MTKRLGKPIEITYQLGHPSEEFRQLSHGIGGKLDGTRWNYDNENGRGYMEYFELDEGLYLYAYESEFFTQVTITRQPSPSGYYFIINYDITGVGISVSSSQPINELGGVSFDGIFFASSRTQATFKQVLNKPGQGIKIVFHSDWIKKFMDDQDEQEENFIHYIINTDIPVHLFEYIDSQSLTLIKELFAQKDNTLFRKIRLLSHTVELIQLFFSKIVNREQKLFRDFHYEDIGNIFEARQLLIRDFEQPPPQLAELARISNMSESKFIKMFKQVFGQPFYQYYQTARMMKAMHLLESRKYSILEVSELVGYQHPGKFAQAFKKHFQKSPRNV